MDNTIILKTTLHPHCQIFKWTHHISISNAVHEMYCKVCKETNVVYNDVSTRKIIPRDIIDTRLCQQGCIAYVTLFLEITWRVND